MAGFVAGSPIAHARQPFQIWKDCQLDENDSNDGDSFHVKAGGQSYILRLYLVDAPETDSGFPERVAEQGKYFWISPAQAVQVGDAAKKFVDEKLAQPFTVRTSKQNAMGRSNKPRFYAFVTTSEGDLGELLVANGLARVHGVAPAADGSVSPKIEKEKLRGLEREAKRQKVGGWGAAGGRITARVGAPGNRQDAFEAFFHPERAAEVASAPVVIAPLPTPVPTPTPAFARAKIASPPGDDLLDPNTATVAELIKLEGIGPILAGRIIEARPFKTADELCRVKGIGPKKYEKIRPQFAPGL
ncbi:MAG: helix-hairpin-helix domain-containing protein [Chthoniobacterales bacterium]